MAIAYRLHKTLSEIDEMSALEYSLWQHYHIIYDLSPAREETIGAIQCDIAARVAGNKTSKVENYIPSYHRRKQEDSDKIEQSRRWLKARSKVIH